MVMIKWIESLGIATRANKNSEKTKQKQRGNQEAIERKNVNPRSGGLTCQIGDASPPALRPGAARQPLLESGGRAHIS